MMMIAIDPNATASAITLANFEIVLAASLLF